MSPRQATVCDTKQRIKWHIGRFKEYTQKNNHSSNYIQIYLLPFYNDWDYLKNFFKSFEQAKCLLLIIDDGSLEPIKYEDIPEKVKHAVLIIRNNKNLGIQKSLNKGIQTIKNMNIPMDIIIHRIDADERYISPRARPNTINTHTIHHSYLHVNPCSIYVPPLILRGYYSWTLLFENIFIHSCASLVLNYPHKAETMYGKVSASKYVEANGAEDYLLWNNQVHQYGVNSWKSSCRITTRGSNRLKSTIVNRAKSTKYLKTKIICFSYIYELYTGTKLPINQLSPMCEPILSNITQFDSAILKLLKKTYIQHHELGTIESMLVSMDTEMRINFLALSKRKVIHSLVMNPLLLIPVLLSRQLLRSFGAMLINGKNKK